MSPETAILGAIILDELQSEFVFELLTPEHFTHLKRKQLFQIMCTLRKEHTEITPITLIEKKADDKYVLDLVSEVITTHGLRSHCDIIINAFNMKRLAYEAGRLLSYAKRDDANVKNALGIVEEMSMRLAECTSSRGLEQLSSISKRVITDLDRVAGGGTPGVLTGFKLLDYNDFIFRNGKMNVIAGRPGMGKSALAIDVARNCGENVAFFSAEMSAEELYERMIATDMNRSSVILRRAESIKQYKKEIMEAIISVNEQKIWIDDNPYKNPVHLINQCKRLKANHGLGLIVVDYLQLLKIGKTESHRHEISEISKTLTRGAKELNVPVVAMAQLNRDCESRPDKRPLLSDLKESGEIEQDAHMVWFIFREEMYNDEAESGKTEILIRKNRSGETGKVLLHYEKGTTHFSDYDENKTW